MYVSYAMRVGDAETSPGQGSSCATGYCTAEGLRT